MFRSYLNNRQIATVNVRKHLSTCAPRPLWSETGNHNFRLSSGTNTQATNFQAILNANNKEMNANFKAMSNANNKEMNANFQAMLNANNKDLLLNFKPSASFSLEAVVGIAGVAVAVVIAFAGLQERTFDRTMAELSPMKEQITQILVNSATTNEKNIQMEKQLTQILDNSATTNGQITQILVNSATTDGQINLINTTNRNILEAINKLQPPRK